MIDCSDVVLADADLALYALRRECEGYRAALRAIRETTLTARTVLDLAATCHNLAKHALEVPG